MIHAFFLMMHAGLRRKQGHPSEQNSLLWWCQKLVFGFIVVYEVFMEIEVRIFLGM